MTACMQSREHQYIFEPVCASVLLRRNASKEPLRSRSTPRIEGQVQLEPLSLHLSQVLLDPSAKSNQCDLQGQLLANGFHILWGRIESYIFLLKKK